MTSTNLDPDRAFRNLDSVDDYHYLLLESPDAEDLFSKYYLDLELEPFQIFCIKLLRGIFRKEEEIWKFIDEHNMDWMFDNGFIKYAGHDGISPHYWEAPNVLVLWPAGFGKTTVVTTRVIPVMSICDNPNARLQLIGKNETEAFSFSSSIRRELLNPRIIEDFGNPVPKDKSVPYSNQAFSVDWREWFDVRQNFEFFGTNSHAELGKRSDKVYIDDVETPDTARTPDMRDKLLEWMRVGPLTSARPMWPRDGNGNPKIPSRLRWSKVERYWSVGVVGTIFHPEAFYAMLMKNPTFTCVKFDCYKDKKCTESIAPSMMTVDMLNREKRSLTILPFNKRYRNIAFNEEEMAFRNSWIRGEEEENNGITISHPGCLDTSRSFGQVLPQWDVYLGFDPASGSTSRFSAYAAYVVLACDPNNEDDENVYLVDYLKIQENFSRMLDHLLIGNPGYGIEGFFSKYHYRNATVEKNAFGKWMVDNDITKPYVDGGTIIPHYTGNDKRDPEAGVFAMGSMVQDGKFRIPYKNPSDEDKAEDFIGEMLMYPKGTCDLVMALWLAQIPMRKNKTKYRSWYTKGRTGRFYHNPAF